jgi:hypothetical protein
VQTQIRSPGLTDRDRADIEGRMALVDGARNVGFDFAVETGEQLFETVKQLEPIAGVSFDNIESIVRNT